MIQLPIIFSQKDDKYKNTKIGDSDVPIGTSGCLLCSLATICRYFGKETDPIRLNNNLKAKDGFQGAYYKWGRLNQIYPDINFTSFVHTPDPLTDEQLTEIEDHSKEEYPVLVKVNNKTSDGHYVVIVGKSGSGYDIADPINGKMERLSKYGVAKKTILRYILYKGSKPVTENEIFKNCWITQARQWPTEEETEEWEKSNNPPYAYVQANAPNPVRDELKELLDNQVTQNSLLRGRIDDFKGLADDYREKYNIEASRASELSQELAETKKVRDDFAIQKTAAQEESSKRGLEIKSLKEELVARDKAIEKLNGGLEKKQTEIAKLKKKVLECSQGESASSIFLPLIEFLKRMLRR